MRLSQPHAEPDRRRDRHGPNRQGPRGWRSAGWVEDDGYVLALTGLLIIPLLIFTVFAVDLGAWYAQGAKMQRAADAAALAGVVWLPDTSAAQTVAAARWSKNGYRLRLPTYSFDTTHNAMTVTISKSATQYFSKVVLKSETLKRTATAQFNLPSRSAAR